MRAGTSTAIVAVMLIAGSPTAEATDPAARCESQKVKVAGDYADCRLTAEHNGIKRGVPPDFTRCEEAFLGKWQKIEDRDGASCPTLEDEAAVQEFVDECTETIATALSGAGFPPLVCQPFLATGQTTQFVMNDDGAFQKGAPLSYTDNGDGTITDNNTGLMWEKKTEGDDAGSAVNLHDVDNTHPWRGSCSIGGEECGIDADCGGGETCDAGDGQTGAPNGMTIFEWVAALNAANFAGHDDWRIPNIRELHTIVDFGSSIPAVDAAFHGASCGSACTDLGDPSCGCTRNASYWSATTYDDDAGDAWTVNFFSGGVATLAKTLPPFVRAVRGGS